ncbi:helix-turn-helix domain-containing protein [Mycobacteroides abscessus]|uniref:helix-turn-helix domain-containing protein n=1 Tax=Mycobacteroides abscessus TaxID=36809 RepID=UPI00189666B6|nr:helix-turn-helix domain-containing protein [Mycobacteroides abscessus]
MANWPWPDDTKDDRYRRIIDHYRTALLEADKEACYLLDKRMADFGQAWISNNDIIDVNAMMTARELSEKHGISVWTIYNWERMGRYRGVKTGARKLFRQGDVLKWC